MPYIVNSCTQSRRRRVWYSVLVKTGIVAMALSNTPSLVAQQNGAGTSGRGHAVALPEGNSSREARESAIKALPFQSLTPEANARLHSVIDNASYFRRMPTQTVDCDPEMFVFLVRHPEVVVNIWEVMGVTKVNVHRSGPYQLKGNDGAGTTSNLDLVYGNESMHIYYSSGSYQGNLWGRELKGKCVVVLYNRPGKLADGTPGLVATMDVFMKLDNLGADLVVKTLGPLVSKTADYNFIECAQFFEQVSMAASHNPGGIQQLAQRLTKVDPKVRDQFLATSMGIAQRSGQLVDARQAIEQGIAKGPLLGDPKKGNTDDRLPTLSLGNKPVPAPVESSSRRTAESIKGNESERVDSPTILLLGSGEEPKKQ